MTNNEAAKWIQLYIDLAKIDPTTGEAAYLNDDDKKTIEAMEMAVNALTAQPETHEKRTETHACDLISRQAAISLPAKPREDRYFQTQSLDDAYDYGWYDLQRCIEKLPSAQPEIVQCKDCKYGAPNGKYGCRVYHYRRYETHDMKPDDFCSRAERRTDE